VQPRLAAIVVALALGFIVVVLAAVRQRRMTEPIAVFWLALFGGLAAFAIFADRRVIDRVAEAAGVLYAPSLYFLLGIVVVFGVLIYFSVQLSVLLRLVRNLAQEVAILTGELAALRERRRPSPAGPREGE
jgi:hypothetical protein